MRLWYIQKELIHYIKYTDSEWVHIGALTKGVLQGLDYEQVEQALDRLVSRGILEVKNFTFYKIVNKRNKHVDMLL